MPARLEGPVTAGDPAPAIDPKFTDLAAHAYVQEEWFASGEAASYEAAGDLGDDGRWTVRPQRTEPFTTRLLVNRPADPERFGGVVIVEWLNVSVIETTPFMGYLHRTLFDEDAAWIGVSAQALGVMGGTPLIQTSDARQQAQVVGGIRAQSPERYGDLHHPGDAFSWDVFGEVAEAIRTDGEALVGGPVTHLVASGQSQSASYLTTWLNAFDRDRACFDGLFLHSRNGGCTSLDGSYPLTDRRPVRLRTDLDTKVLVFQTETDVGPLLESAIARQPDTDRIVTWEVAGTAHADAYLVGEYFDGCPQRLNDGPHVWVANAALTALLGWVRGGGRPVGTDPIETVEPTSPRIVRDADGIARGGIRTPSVEVPVATPSGETDKSDERMCRLFGESNRFPPEQLVARYGDRDTYLTRFEAVLDEAVAAGFVRAADRADYAAEARTVPFPDA